MRQKMADFFNLVFGFRKFIAWLALFLVAIFFRLKGYVDGSQFVDLMKATFLAFVAANGVEHLVSVAKDYVAGKSNTSDDVVTPEEVK